VSKHVITYLFLLMLSIPALCQSDESTISVEISTDTIYVNHVFGVRYKTVNLPGQFQPPSFEGFDVMGGPMTSSSFSSINGVRYGRTRFKSWSSTIQKEYYHQIEGCGTSMVQRSHQISKL